MMTTAVELPIYPLSDDAIEATVAGLLAALSTGEVHL